MLNYIFKPIISFVKWIFSPIIQYLNPIFFYANKQQYFINFLRFTIGCFFECFPISSSFFNTLLYRFKDEHKIYKNNVYIHFLTGIASMIIFIQLSKSEFISNNYTINNFSIFFIKCFIFAQSIILNHLYQLKPVEYKSFSNLIIFILNCMVFPWVNFHNIDYSCLFWIYNCHYIIRTLMIAYMDIFPKKYNLWVVIISIIILLIGFPIINPWVFIFLISGLKALSFGYFGSVEEKTLLYMGFFLNNYFANSWININDIVIILSVFIYKIINKYMVHPMIIMEDKSKNLDLLLKIVFIIFMNTLVIYLMKNFPINTINPIIMAPVGLLICFPIIKFIKKKYYRNLDPLCSQKVSLLISIITTIIFSIVLYNYQNKVFINISNPLIIYFFMGFFNGLALIPGFSRMLLTFLTGFLLGLPWSDIILINYGLASLTSIGQWIVDNWVGQWSVHDIIEHFNKKFNFFLLSFSYKNNPWQSMIIIVFLIGWSYFLMNKFLSSLIIIGFWKKCIILRIVSNLIFLVLSKYHF